VGDTGGGVTALDVSSSGGDPPRQAWTTRVGTTSYGSIVTDGSGRIYTTADSALVALDDLGTSVREAWRANPDDNITEVSAGLAPDGTVLLGTNGNREWAYRPTTVDLPPNNHLLLAVGDLRRPDLRRRPLRPGPRPAGERRDRGGRLPGRTARADLERGCRGPRTPALLRNPGRSAPRRRTRRQRALRRDPGRSGRLLPGPDRGRDRAVVPAASP